MFIVSPQQIKYTDKIEFCGGPPKWAGGWCIFFPPSWGWMWTFLWSNRRAIIVGYLHRLTSVAQDGFLSEEVKSPKLIHFCLLVSNAFCRGQCWPGAYQDTLGILNAEATWGTWRTNLLNKAATFRWWESYYCPPSGVIPIVHNWCWKKAWTERAENMKSRKITYFSGSFISFYSKKMNTHVQRGLDQWLSGKHQ